MGILDLLEFDGKVAPVTGAGSGIGSASCKVSSCGSTGQTSSAIHAATR